MAEDKPEKPKKSLFKKPKKPKPKKSLKPSGPKTEYVFSKFAQHVKEEFKNAMDEIKPKALLGHGADSLKSIKNIVNRGDGDEDLDRTSADSVDTVEDESPVQRQATEGLSTEVRPEEVFEAHSLQGNADGGAPVEFSAAKLQRAPKKKPKEEPGEAAPVEFSAAKVQRAPKKKIQEVAEDQYEELAEETEDNDETNGEPEPEAKKAAQKSKEPGTERGPSEIVHKHAQAAARMSKTVSSSRIKMASF